MFHLLNFNATGFDFTMKSHLRNSNGNSGTTRDGRSVEKTNRGDYKINGKSIGTRTQALNKIR